MGKESCGTNFFNITNHQSIQLLSCGPWCQIILDIGTLSIIFVKGSAYTMAL